jgi:hypothetical protein
MKEMKTYLDITEDDLKKIYAIALSGVLVLIL